MSTGKRLKSEQLDGSSSSDDHDHSTLHPSLHHPVARAWSEPVLAAKHLMYPLFVSVAEEDKEISGFAPNKQWGKKNGYASLIEHLQRLHRDYKLSSCMLFGVVDQKDANGSKADTDDTPVIVALKKIRENLPDLFVAMDVCLCEYTDHGHCGTLKKVGENDSALSLDGPHVIDNADTIHTLARIAVSYAKAGAHMVCPSDMMDGRVGTIKKALEANGYHHVMIMAYTSKKASSFYAPFRKAVDSTFTGNRKRYQHPIGSSSHAHRALERDIEEGADVVIVKPALFYGDIIQSFASRTDLPVAVYVVSGEYVMLKGYADQIGDLRAVVEESHLSLLRAGASILITYFTPELLRMLKDNQL